MRRPQKRSIDRLVRYALDVWKIPEWKVTWRYGECSSEAEIDIVYTEKEAGITLDPKYVEHLCEHFGRKEVWKRLTRDIVHETGHIVLYVLSRSVDDWADHRISPEERAVFDESYNSGENVILDHLITRVFKL